MPSKAKSSRISSASAERVRRSFSMSSIGASIRGIGVSAINRASSFCLCSWYNLDVVGTPEEGKSLSAARYIQGSAALADRYPSHR